MSNTEQNLKKFNLLLKIEQEYDNKFFLEISKKFEIFGKIKKNLPLDTYLIFQNNYKNISNELTKRTVFYDFFINYNNQEAKSLIKLIEFIMEKACYLERNFDFLLSALIIKNYLAGLLLNCLYKNEFNIEKSYTLLINHFKAILTYSEVKFSKSLVENGFLYIFGKDYKHSPNLYFDISVFSNYCNDFASKNNNDLELLKDKLMAYFIFAIRYIDEYLLIPGQIESFNLIIDTISLKEKKVQAKIFTDMINEISNTIILNISRIFILNFTEEISTLIKKKFKDTSLVLVKDKEFLELNKYINKFQLQNKHSGLCNNLISNKFPTIKEVGKNYFTNLTDYEGHSVIEDYLFLQRASNGLNVYSSIDIYNKFTERFNKFNLNEQSTKPNSETKSEFSENEPFTKEILEVLKLNSINYLKDQDIILFSNDESINIKS